MNYYLYDSYGLDDDQKEIAAELYEENKRMLGNLTLEKVDEKTLEIWRDNTDDNEYQEFLNECIEERYEVYTLTDHLGGFSQAIGEFAVK